MKSFLERKRDVCSLRKIWNILNIKCLNFCSFPQLLSEITCDKEELRVKIDRAIRNINGIRPCLNTPHMAFESIVREEIGRLEEPITTCVSLVGDLLREAVRVCTHRVS